MNMYIWCNKLIFQVAYQHLTFGIFEIPEFSRVESSFFIKVSVGHPENFFGLPHFLNPFHLYQFALSDSEQMASEPLEDKWQVVAELRSILAIAGIPMKSRTVNALVEIIDARPNVSVEALVAVLEELKKIKTYSVLINR